VLAPPELPRYSTWHGAAGAPLPRCSAVFSDRPRERHHRHASDRDANARLFCSGWTGYPGVRDDSNLVFPRAARLSLKFKYSIMSKSKARTGLYLVNRMLKEILAPVSAAAQKVPCEVAR
jgi:hypothetical protein